MAKKSKPEPQTPKPAPQVLKPFGIQTQEQVHTGGKK